MLSKRLERIQGLLRDLRRYKERKEFDQCSTLLRRITELLNMNDHVYEELRDNDVPFKDLSDFFDFNFRR